MKTILTHLQQAFAAWRSSSPKKRYSNAILREQALQCLSDFTYREVSVAAGISVNTLRSWQKPLRDNQKTHNSSTDFIAIKLDPTEHANRTKTAPLTLQVSLACGILIKVESESIAATAELIAALNKESHSCSI